MPHRARNVFRGTEALIGPINPARIASYKWKKPGGCWFQPKFFVNDPGAYCGICGRLVSQGMILYNFERSVNYPAYAALSADSSRIRYMLWLDGVKEI